MAKGDDAELDGPRIQAVLATLGEATLYSWRHAGEMRYAVVVCEDPDDRFTRKIGADDEPAEREAWQRANTVLAIGPEINRVLWYAKRQAMAPFGLTLWFDRAASQYHLGPRCKRYGKSGRPAWADEATATPGGLILPS